jgi:transcriptional regulator with XRE-family HTH domain
MVTELKLRRMKAGLKQLQIFKETGIDRSRLSLIENGWIDPKPDELKKIQAVISAHAKNE